MRGERYCRTECLELALLEILMRAHPTHHSAATAPHRIPLGLLLLSRQQLTAAQLRTALEAQRAAGRSPKQNTIQKKMKIGAWLQELGFATEQQVTAALARQWSCPVLRTASAAMGAGPVPPIFPGIPLPLLESFQRIPVELVEATKTLLVAFSEGIDYTVLYAIEQMLGYHTEACLVCPSTLQKGLQALAGQRSASDVVVQRDVVFERMEDAGECARIIGNYSAKVKAREVRLARCGDHLWIRLERLRQEAVTIVLHTGSGLTVLSTGQFVESPG
jgi:hypothetical protein